MVLILDNLYAPFKAMTHIPAASQQISRIFVAAVCGNAYAYGGISPRKDIYINAWETYTTTKNKYARGQQ